MGEVRKRGQTYWIRYYRNGKRYEESAGSDKKTAAIDLLKLREGDGARGLPVTPKIGRLRFEEAAQDVINDYRVNGKRSLEVVERKIAKHLSPFFGGRRMAAITTADVRTFIVERQAATHTTSKACVRRLPDGRTINIRERVRAITGVSNGEINRELGILKRTFNLAI